MMDPGDVVKQVVRTWNDHFHGLSTGHAIQEIAEKAALLDLIRQSNLLTVIFSFNDLSIIHVSQAAAALFGSSVDEIKSAGASFLISCFEAEQLKFAVQAAELSAREIERYTSADVLNSYTCYANWIIHGKSGEKKRAFFRIFPVMLNEHGLPLIGMYLVHDVRPFLREGTWWYRSSVGEKHFMCYHSDDQKIIRKDLLSAREKSVLKLLAEGHSSKELGDMLHLSNHTIDNHRRRMLAKTGAVDTSALIYIAKLSGLLP